MASKSDRYPTFAALADAERLGVDYRIVLELRDARVAVIAPHGGSIEPGTSEVATAIAGRSWSLYKFEGLRRHRRHRDLHITSTNFDEPECTNLVSAAEVVVAVHGRANAMDPETVWLGGADAELIRVSQAALKKDGFAAEHFLGHIDGSSLRNICNRGKRSKGLQLELPRMLRNRLMANRDLLAQFSKAIGIAISLQIG